MPRPVNRPFIAARIEDRLLSVQVAAARRLGWTERVIVYPGYGGAGFVRVLARVVLAPHELPDALPDALSDAVASPLLRRGWRNFVTVPAPHAEVEITVGDTTWEGRANRGGHVDAHLAQKVLDSGWQTVQVQAVRGRRDPVEAPVFVVDPLTDFGIVSDIDDTVISTSLPRPLIAAWNTFVLHESARQVVPGMPQLYEDLLRHHPGAPTVYVSTGAWNVAPTLRRFLRHHGLPAGPLLLTDWGPTNSGWFRNGPAHKRECLAQLASDFPEISWVLVGDDGQHDPALYTEFADRHPERTRVIAIRQLSVGEQILAHGSLTTMDRASVSVGDVPEVRGVDGHALARQLRHLRALDDTVAETLDG